MGQSALAECQPRLAFGPRARGDLKIDLRCEKRQKLHAKGANLFRVRSFTHGKLEAFLAANSKLFPLPPPLGNAR
jgi:hypothetical protein